MEDEIKFAFGKSLGEQQIAKSLLNNGLITPDEVVMFSDVVNNIKFQSLARLLIIMSDRVGRKEDRKEDAYAKFPVELTVLMKELMNKINKKEDKPKIVKK